MLSISSLSLSFSCSLTHTCTRTHSLSRCIIADQQSVIAIIMLLTSYDIYFLDGKFSCISHCLNLIRNWSQHRTLLTWQICCKWSGAWAINRTKQWPPPYLRLFLWDASVVCLALNYECVSLNKRILMYFASSYNLIKPKNHTEEKAKTPTYPCRTQTTSSSNASALIFNFQNDFSLTVYLYLLFIIEDSNIYVEAEMGENKDRLYPFTFWIYSLDYVDKYVVSLCTLTQTLTEIKSILTFFPAYKLWVLCKSHCPLYSYRCNVQFALVEQTVEPETTNKNGNLLSANLSEGLWSVSLL